MIKHSAMKFDQKLQRWAKSQNTVLDHKKVTRQKQRQSDYRSKACTKTLQCICQSEKKIHKLKEEKKAPKSAEIRIDLQK